MTHYWATYSYIFFHVLPSKHRYPAIVKHGVLFLLIFWEGAFYSRIPLRGKLSVFPGAFIAIFGAWTFIQSHYGPSNPEFYGQEHEQHPEDDDAIYPQLNWRKRPAQASCLWLSGFVLIPLHFFALWTFLVWWGIKQRNRSQ